MFWRHSVCARCLSRAQAAQQTSYCLWRHGTGTDHSASRHNMALDFGSNELLLVAELLPTITMYRLEVSPKISSAAARASRQSAAPSQLDAAPEGGQVPVTAQEAE